MKKTEAIASGIRDIVALVTNVNTAGMRVTKETTAIANMAHLDADNPVPTCLRTARVMNRLADELRRIADAAEVDAAAWIAVADDYTEEG